MKRKVLVGTLCGVAFCALIAITIVGNLYGSEMQTAPTVSSMSVSTSNGGQTEVQELVTQYVTGTVSEKKLDDLVRESNLIIHGTVEGPGQGLQIQAVGGGITNYTDYTVHVEETFAGDTQESVTVRVKGGIAGNLEVICDYAPDLEEGKEYLLFLLKPDQGGGYNTEGDYYYVTGSFQGVYELEGTKDEPATAMKAKPQSGGEEKVVAQLASDIQELRAQLPEDYEYSVREEGMKNLQANLESGFISQEEYEQMLAEREQYATILN